MYEAMKKLFFLFSVLLLCIFSFAQTVTKRLEDAYQKFENDSQLRNGITSLYVINAKTGEVVFDKNSTIGLATASTLKIITAASAYEFLGKDFRYETKFGYVGKIKGRSLQGSFYIKPSGDPTLGSWRWKGTLDSNVLDKMITAVKKLNITNYNGVVVDSMGWYEETLPDGWIWQDVGNYYGAGATGFNWRENQFDLVLQSGKNIGDAVSIVRTKPEYFSTPLVSLAKSAAKGSGDNAYVYYPLQQTNGIVRGTIPINENAFVISASSPQSANAFVSFLTQNLSKNKIFQTQYKHPSFDTTILFSHYSPSLDSIIFWFLKRSINLYGEALVKTLAYQKKGTGSTDEGVDLVKELWKTKGINPTELNIVDGSGLSPLNRVTTHAQVQILQYAKSKSWFAGYYNAFPIYNNMRMKSGSIRDVRSFCGYHTSRDGQEYIFSFLVNNYNGSSSAVIQKMYKVLDVLK